MMKKIFIHNIFNIYITQFLYITEKCNYIHFHDYLIKIIFFKFFSQLSSSRVF